MEKTNIFLVEDNITENILLKLSLNSFDNIHVESFVNGRALINNLSLNPDIILVDLMLPDISGVELIKLIKEYDENITIVVVSAQKNVDVIAEIQELGVCNYIVKSDKCLELLHKVIEDLLIISKYKKSLNDLKSKNEFQY